MHNRKEINVITLSDHAAFEKNELGAEQKSGSAHRDKDMDFAETLLGFLGKKRSAVISFIRMKLEPRYRSFFDIELKECENLRQQARCIKKYIGRLKVNDAKTLLLNLPEMLSGKIEALAYHGEASPENRLMKFAKTFELSDADALFCMLFFLMTRQNTGTADTVSMGQAV